MANTKEYLLDWILELKNTKVKTPSIKLKIQKLQQRVDELGSKKTN